MKVAIVDDDQKIQLQIKQALQEYGEQSDLALDIFTYSNGESFLLALQEQTFEMVFMDIFMEGIDGMEAAMNLRQSQNPNSLLIFLTSSPEFMAQAFSYHAFDYILKPVKKERIFQLFQEAQSFLPKDSPYMEITSGRKSYRIFLHQIVSAVSDAHYLDITSTEGRVYRCRMTMRQFYEKANQDKRFLSLNKGVYINIDQISHIHKGSCYLKNGAVFPIRLRDISKVESLVHEYNFLRIRQNQRSGAAFQ